MKPIDYRNATFAEIQSRISDDRLAVLQGLREHGPCTTRELSEKLDWDILNVRPRVTELGQLGFVEIINPKSSIRNPQLRGGTYRALSDREAELFFIHRRNAVINPQLTLI